MDLIFRIIEKDRENSICLIQILGFEKIPIVASSIFLNNQNYNTVFYGKDIEFSLKEGFIYLSERSCIRGLFFENNLLKGISEKTIGNQTDPLLNYKMTGYFKNNIIDFDDIFEKSHQSSNLSLTGIIYKMNKIKNTIILKILDFKNLIDTHKVYINTRSEKDLEFLDEKLTLNQLISIGSNLRQTISKSLKLVYSVNYNKFTDLTVKRGLKMDFTNIKAFQRIQVNPKNTSLPLTELVNLNPFSFHRGIHKLFVEVLSINYLSIKLFCRTCR